MVPLEPQPADAPDVAYDLMEWRSGAEAADAPLQTDLDISISPPAAGLPQAAVPVLRCGWCHAVVEAVGSGRGVRCRHCRRHVIVPGHIHVTCDRCRHRTRIRPQTIGAPRLCTRCGAPLVIGDIVLTPQRRSRARRHRRHGRVFSPAYADAAWAVLIVGVALVVALLAIS